jgi:hypothetical protein
MNAHMVAVVAEQLLVLRVAAAWKVASKTYSNAMLPTRRVSVALVLASLADLDCLLLGLPKR